MKGVIFMIIEKMPNEKIELDEAAKVFSNSIAEFYNEGIRFGTVRGIIIGCFIGVGVVAINNFIKDIK